QDLVVGARAIAEEEDALPEDLGVLAARIRPASRLEAHERRSQEDPLVRLGPPLAFEHQPDVDLPALRLAADIGTTPGLDAHAEGVSSAGEGLGLHHREEHPELPELELGAHGANRDSSEIPMESIGGLERRDRWRSFGSSGGTHVDSSFIGTPLEESARGERQ